jgi:hypothetical protein
MTIVAEPEPDLARLRPLFVLEKLSRRLRSDVLADGSIISACGFTRKRSSQLTDDIAVIRDELLAAFRNASKSPSHASCTTSTTLSSMRQFRSTKMGPE